MQVALATLWSCFPVSASGADVLLFSLLHTSSGSCCSPETNHGLLRSSHSPFFFLSLSLSLCFFESSLSLSLLTVLFLVFSLYLSVSLLLALLPFGHAKAALPQHGHPGYPRGEKRPGPQRSSPPWRRKKERNTPPYSLILSLQLTLFPWKSSSQSSAPSLNLYLLYLFYCWWLAAVLRIFFFLLFMWAAGAHCDLHILFSFSQWHYQETITRTQCLLWWLQYLKTFKSLQVDFYNSLKWMVINSCLEGRKNI